MTDAEKKWKDFADKKRVVWAWDSLNGVKGKKEYYHELIPAYKDSLRSAIEERIVAVGKLWPYATGISSGLKEALDLINSVTPKE